MPLDLPQPVAMYLAAEQAKDPDMLARVFAEDAHVHDEARDYDGLAAIIAWKREAETKYQYVLEPLAASGNGATITLRARLSGTFPGSPVEVDYTFTLAKDRVTSLVIG